MIDGLLPKLPRFQAQIPSINLVFKQYTIESMVYFSRLPKFASPVGYEELSQSKTAKYFEWTLLIINNGGHKKVRRTSVEYTFKVAAKQITGLMLGCFK